MTRLVGILNITPDSFSDGGQFVTPAAIIARAEQLFSEGATIVDIGAESTRPGAIALTHEQEWRRLEPILPQLIATYPRKISLDSYHPETIERALKLGPIIVNDITGLTNQAMIDVVLNYQPTVIINHLPGHEIQKAHFNTLIDNIEIVTSELLNKVTILLKHGYDTSKIILDPGIGFGKTARLNHELLTFASQLPTYAVMIGYSRKRFLGENRMDIEPNLLAGKAAIASGAAYLRVHDVKAHSQLLYS